MKTAVKTICSLNNNIKPFQIIINLQHSIIGGQSAERHIWLGTLQTRDVALLG